MARALSSHARSRERLHHATSRGTHHVQDELLLDTGIAKLTDFGLSKTIASVLPPPPLFGNGARFGSRGGRGAFSEFPRIPECSSSGILESSAGDSGGVIPPLRLDGLVAPTALLGREHSGGGMQAHVPPQPRPGASPSLAAPAPSLSSLVSAFNFPCIAMTSALPLCSHFACSAVSQAVTCFMEKCAPPGQTPNTDHPSVTTACHSVV